MAAAAAAFAFLAVLAVCQYAGAQSCSKQVKVGSAGGTYSECLTLPVLGASLAYTPSADGKGASVAFSAKPAASAGWVAWGINLKTAKMVGAQVLLAYGSGSAGPTVHSYRLVNASGPFAPVTSLDFRVTDLKAAQSSDGRFHIFANVSGLPSSSVNLVWQVGSEMSGDSPKPHTIGGDNLKSVKAGFSLASSSSPLAPSPSPANPSPASPANHSPMSAPSPSGTAKTAAAPAPTKDNNPAAPSRAGSGALVAATVVLGAVAVLLRPASF